MADWIKLHRKSIDSRVFSDANLWRLWCWCLIKSNWKRGWHLGCELQPGQFATGREAASEELGVSGSAWYRGMQKLQEFGCVKLEVNNRFTKVSIVNWVLYQGDLNNQRTTGEQPENNGRTATEQLADTIEEGLEGLEVKKERKKLSHAMDEFPKSSLLDNPEFVAAWDRWGRYCLEIGKPMTPSVSAAQLMEIERNGLGADEAVLAIDFTIMRGSRHLILNGDHKQSTPRARTRGGRKSNEELVLRD